MSTQPMSTKSLILLDQNRAMMVGCRLLSEAGDSLCETLISLADRSICKSLETLITSWSVFSLSSQDSPWNSRHSRRPYCSRLLISSCIWPDSASSLQTWSLRSWLSMRRVFTSSSAECRCFFILVRQELLALSNLPHLYQLDKGAAVLDKSFRHLV